ncbi:RT0821/Lpp0805 family surface protein [Mangrovibrevibacter kandeliae]|uniref:RT0821/Lpp0805 family surface protein n=1 Tax=Mangrovibrevibacter kandeliae TaxID=2968473 RepID=UPI002117B6E9|nr:RT0821/Lpp0805 family surface protein [Aurantimonas sp. CSK15Z-1]MCQ8781094.1 RT0821/Lpp0805 family surface protein [Aurantimonas sp. CSK15Z-1]
MARLFRFLLLATATLAVAGCQTSGSLTASGASAEGAAGLGDGLIGRVAGVRVPTNARGQALLAEYQALQFGTAGQVVAWSAGGLRGTVTPTQLYRVGSQECRGYVQSVVAGGTESKVMGTACRTEGGQWTLVA